MDSSASSRRGAWWTDAEMAVALKRRPAPTACRRGRAPDRGPTSPGPRPDPSRSRHQRPRRRIGIARAAVRPTFLIARAAPYPPRTRHPCRLLEVPDALAERLAGRIATCPTPRSRRSLLMPTGREAQRADGQAPEDRSRREPSERSVAEDRHRARRPRRNAPTAERLMTAPGANRA